jgi:hypothetical protein
VVSIAPQARRTFHKPFHVLTIDTLHVSTDSLRSASTEFEPPPKDSKALVAEQSEVLSEISETSAACLQNARRVENNHSDNGNAPLYSCGPRSM